MRKNYCNLEKYNSTFCLWNKIFVEELLWCALPTKINYRMKFCTDTFSMVHFGRNVWRRLWQYSCLLCLVSGSLLDSMQESGYRKGIIWGLKRYSCQIPNSLAKQVKRNIKMPLPFASRFGHIYKPWLNGILSTTWDDIFYRRSGNFRVGKSSHFKFSLISFPPPGKVARIFMQYNLQCIIRT